MKYHCLWVLIVMSVVGVTDSLLFGPSAKSPHIVFIVADDLGFNDVSFRADDMYSPNIDRMAREGIILNSSYVQPLCSPSRSAFLTGLFPYHTGLQHNIIFDRQKSHLPGNVTTLPEVLKAHGYATHMVGKWHLGFCNLKHTPTYRGFDTFLGFYSGAEDYYNHTQSRGYDFRNNTEVERSVIGQYSAHVFTQHTEKLLRAHNRYQPLFLYLPFQSVHEPLEAPQEYIDNYCSHINNTDRRIKCERGPVPYAGNNWPLRGAKGSVWEGGTRATAFVWSNNLFSRTGYTNTGMMHAADWFPTIIEAAGATFNTYKIDGVSQWDTIRHGTPSPRNEFVYNIDSMSKIFAIRHGDYKLVSNHTGGHNGWYPVPRRDHPPTTEADEAPPSTEDPEERRDLAESQPDVLQQMKARLHAWRATEVPAHYPPSSPEANPSLLWGGVWSPGWC